MRGLSCEREIVTLKKVKGICMVHQVKDMNVL